jgi:hypothetical protein
VQANREEQRDAASSSNVSEAMESSGDGRALKANGAHDDSL